jgi:uncharacterized RDD family membrane protein YckC
LDQPIDHMVPLWRRLAAACYDALVVLALWFIATAVAMPLAHGAITPEHPLAELLYRLYILAVGLLFFGGFWVRNGQTLGMLAWRVKVVQASSGAKITWMQALKRYLGAIGTWLALGCAIYVVYGMAPRTDLDAIFGYWISAIFVVIFITVFRRAPARFGGITWYDKFSGTRLIPAASFTEISNPKN